MISFAPEPIPKYDDDGRTIPYAARLEIEVGRLRGALDRIAIRPSNSGCGMCHREDPEPCADWCVRAKAVEMLRMATAVGTDQVKVGDMEKRIGELEMECVRLVREANRRIAAALREAGVGTDVVPLLTSEVVGGVLGRRRG